MDDVETIAIPTGKLKMSVMLLGCLLFVVFGIGFVISPEKYSSFLVRSNTIIFLAGCLAVMFFGFVGFSILKRLIENAPGLIISEDGITDNSSGVPAGFIPWSDIIAVRKQ